jgi:uncharacterized membrane protein
MSEKKITGPIQVLIVGFDNLEASGKILAELKRVRRRGVIRLVDLLFVQKDDSGGISNTMHLTDFSDAERQRLGAIAGSLIGLEAGDGDDTLAAVECEAMALSERDFGLSSAQICDLADSIPNGSSAAVVVIEHHWATHLRDAIVEAGGITLAQAMVSPEALLMVGEELRAISEAEEAIEAAELVKYAAAMDVALVLAEADLIEQAALAEAADAVATALAMEDAAAEDVAETLVAAALLEQAALDEAAEMVSIALEVEEEAEEEAIAAVGAAEDLEATAALEAIRALLAAQVIEQEAAAQAISALIAADIIEEEAADEALDDLLSD